MNNYSSILFVALPLNQLISRVFFPRSNLTSFICNYFYIKVVMRESNLRRIRLGGNREEGELRYSEFVPILTFYMQLLI